VILNSGHINCFEGNNSVGALFLRQRLSILRIFFFPRPPTQEPSPSRLSFYTKSQKIDCLSGDRFNMAVSESKIFLYLNLDSVIYFLFQLNIPRVLQTKTLNSVFKNRTFRTRKPKRILRVRFLYHLRVRF
jgi:hypothetical protein